MFGIAAAMLSLGRIAGAMRGTLACRWIAAARIMATTVRRIVLALRRNGL
jgi:hypothetical protein